MRLALDHPGAFASPLRGFDPRWKILSILLFAVVVAVLQNVLSALIAFALALGLAIAARLPARWYRRRLGFVALLLALLIVWLPFLEPGPVWNLGPLHVSQAGVLLAFVVLLKAMTIVSLFLTLWATSPPGATLKAAQSMYVPATVLHLFALSYRYLHLFAEELGRMRIALRVRGYRNRSNAHSYRTIGNVAGMLLVRSYERAERVSQAMRCRGFDGCYRSLVTLRTGLHDVVSFLLMAGVGAGLLTLDLLL